MLRVRKDFDLEKLKFYGFRNTAETIYYLETETNTDFIVGILVNSTHDFENNEVTIYHSNDGFEPEEVDGIATFPDVIYTMILDGVIELVRKGDE